MEKTDGKKRGTEKIDATVIFLNMLTSVGKTVFHNEHLLTDGSFKETLEVFQTPKFKAHISSWSQ